jgi:hypothetical protein
MDKEVLPTFLERTARSLPLFGIELIEFVAPQGVKPCGANPFYCSDHCWLGADEQVERINGAWGFGFAYGPGFGW